MKKVLLLLVALTGAIGLHAAIGVSLQAQLGNPTNATSSPTNRTNYLIQRAQYWMDYHDVRGVPNWVSWNLTSADVGLSGRSSFIEDDTLPSGFYRVKTTDYSGSGYDRGHLCPSADRTSSTANNQPTFYMSNMAPQTPDNNQGVWADFESHCRSLASAGNELLITAGMSHFSGARLPSGAAAIPGYFWKIVVVVPVGSGTALSRITSDTRVIVVKMPNIAGIRTNPWRNYVTSAAQIETDTGHTFFTAVPSSVAAVLRAKVDGQTNTSTAPVFTQQPLPQTTTAGGSATFAVTATGEAPVTYQWYRDGVILGGATTSTLTLNNVQIADVAAYDVTATNLAGTTRSNAANLATAAAVAPSTITWDFTTATPSSAIPVGVSVSALTHGNNNGTTALLSTTSASNTYAGFSAGNNAGSAARTGSLNQATDGSAYFTFTLTPPENTQLVIDAINFGSRSTSTGPRAYEIFTSVGDFSTSVASGVLLNNSTWALHSASFANPVSGVAGTPVTVRIYGTNGTGTPTANTANWRIDDLAVTVRIPPAAPALTTQPLSQTVPEGGNASFTAAMSSPGTVTYLWRKNGVVIPGATSATLALTNVSSADNGSYRAVLTNDGGSIVSAAATLTVAEAPTSAVTWNFDTAAPTSGLPDGVTGGTVTQGNNNGTTPLLSTTSASSGYTGVSGGNNAGAAARIGALNTATSGSAFFTFTLTPPSDRRLALELISFGSRSTGTGPQGFTVYTSINNFAAPLVVGSLANNSTWAVTPLLDAKATGTTGAPVTVRIYGHSGAGSPSIDTANWRIDDLKLTVRSVAALPIVTTHPQSQIVAESGTTILTVAASGAAPLSYQWRKDGGLIFGATEISYSIDSAAAEDAGSYSVEVTNAAGTVTSNPALIILAQSINFAAPATRWFGSGAFDLAATASSGLPVTYALVSGPANVTGRTVTPTGVGTITIRAAQTGSADYAAATAVERSFAVQSDFAYWQQTRFTNGELADPALSGPNAIYGTDGVPNLVKYALGLEPLQDASTPLALLSVGGADWIFTYTRPVERADLSYSVERSTDLVNWTTADVTHEQLSTDGSTAIWRARVSVATASNSYFRLKVTRP